MNCYIKNIILFGKNSEKREVPLKPGLNIITGASQTGKSALIEIVDYCFCSRFSSIPRGKISDWTSLFCIVLKKNDEYLIIGRRNFENGGDTKMYSSIETNYEVIDKITEAYFNNQIPQKLTSVKKQISHFFGLNVKNTNETLHSSYKGHTASIRNLTSFMFQHQNLIASKHALFSRFDDPMRKKDTINQLPVFLGWAGDKYYTFVREMERLTERRTKLNKLIEKEKDHIQKQKEDLNAHYKNYYSIIGKRFNESYSVEELLSLRNKLPDYNEKTFVSETLSTRFIELKDHRDKLKRKRDYIQKRITNLELYDNYTTNYQVTLLELENKSRKGTNIKSDNYKYCPVCGQDSSEMIIAELKKVQQSKVDLKNELAKTKDFREDYSSELQKLKIEKELFDHKLRKTNSQLKELERQFKAIEDYKSTSERAIYAKAKLDFVIENISKSSLLESYKFELKDINKEIKDLYENLGVFDIKGKIDKAQKLLNNSINNICSNLDFEERFKPVKSNFNIDDFSFSVYDEKTKGRIKLSELGSGSNWLAVHLGVFLSFLELFSIEENSKMPSILFLDQPSQIYFPNEPSKEETQQRNKEFEKVANIYDTILDKIQAIKNKCGYEPQIIVSDHADHLKLKDGYDFENYVTKRWWSDSQEKALI